MIYLCSHFENTYLLPISHHFYDDGKFYCVSCSTEYSIYKSFSQYYIRSETGRYQICDKFYCELPSILVYIEYSDIREMIEVLNKIITYKILDSI